MSQPEILTHTQGNLGVITLNRPKAVNALSHNMIGMLDQALTTFEHDDGVHAVVLRGAGDRGLCAGGDVVSIYQSAINNDPAAVEPFFRDEYTLDHRIRVYPKPYVALMHGLVLGGGVGISVSASHRVVTESTRFGMPEVGIGFSPDVGGCYHLARTPGHIGTYMALTGVHISGADAVYAGLADVVIADKHLDTLLTRLATTTSATEIQEVLAACQTPVHSRLQTQAHWIDEVFAAPTVETILAGVERSAGQGNDFAAQTLSMLQRNSPLAMKVTLEALTRARHQTLAETLAQDLRTTMHAVNGTELAEGIRAQLIDKDRTPQWQPACLDAVTDANVQAFFEPVAGIPDLVIKH